MHYGSLKLIGWLAALHLICQISHWHEVPRKPRMLLIDCFHSVHHGEPKLYHTEQTKTLYHAHFFFGFSRRSSGQIRNFASSKNTVLRSFAYYSALPVASFAGPRDWQDAWLVRSGNTHGGLTVMHYKVETADSVIEVMGSRLKLTINKKTQITFAPNRGKI
jgi:hypothetical protein